MRISAQDLSVRVGRRAVVHGVDLRFDVGVLGLLGPNGAGKTTLMRALATALPISGGALELFGVDLRRPGGDLPAVRRRIGYAPQLPLVLRHLAVADQVAYAAWLKGLDRASGAARARVALEQVNLADRAKDRTRTLSGGMLRRLGIAMALVAEPEILLLDEPTAGLDPEQRVAFRELVTELGRNRVVVLSTHLIEDVAAVCSRIIVLSGGRQVFDGDAKALAAHGDDADGTRSAIESGFAAVTQVAQP